MNTEHWPQPWESPPAPNPSPPNNNIKIRKCSDDTSEAAGSMERA